MSHNELGLAVARAIAKYRNEITEHELAIENLKHRMAAAETFSEEVLPDIDFGSIGVASTRNYGAVKLQITDAIWEVLREERPLHRETILARVKQKGVYVSGEADGTEMHNFAPYLSQDHRFRSVDRKGTWTLDDGCQPQQEQPESSYCISEADSQKQERGMESEVSKADEPGDTPV